MRRPRRWTARTAAAGVLGLALVPAVLAPVQASTSGDMDDMGGMHPSAAATAATAATQATDTADQSADAHVDLPQGGQKWTHPDDVAQGAVVQIQTTADVYVGLHINHVHQYSYDDIPDPDTTSTGVYINSRGAVVTSAGAVLNAGSDDDSDEVRRFVTYGVNRAFKDYGLLSKLPEDEFSRTKITDSTKGPAADERVAGDSIRERLQNCYDWKTSRHCAVFVVLHTKILPSVQHPQPLELEGLPQADHRVAVLSTRPSGVTPLTLQLSNPPAKSKYWVVSSNGVNKQPVVGTGVLTADETTPLSAADLQKWSAQFGSQAQGAAVVNERGDLVAILGTRSTGGNLEAVPASHLSNDIATFGLKRDSSTTDADFQDGLELSEAKQYASAVPKLQKTVDATGGQFAAVALLATAEAKAGTAEDLSDEVDANSSAASDPASWSPLAIGLFVLLLVIIAAAVIAGWFRTRRRHPGGDPGTEAVLAADPPSSVEIRTSPDPPTMPRAMQGGAAGAEPAAAGAVKVDAGQLETAQRKGPTTVFARGGDPAPRPAPLGQQAPSPAGAGGYCRACGAQLSPGDRFCFSCGTPAVKG